MTQPNTVSPRTYAPQDRLYVWAMLNPGAPTLVGELGLSQLVSDCATFTYAPQWWNFALSEDRAPRLTECATGPLRLQHRLSALDPRLRQSLLGEGLRFCGHNRALVFKTHLRRVWEVAPTD